MCGEPISPRAGASLSPAAPVIGVETVASNNDRLKRKVPCAWNQRPGRPGHPLLPFTTHVGRSRFLSQGLHNALAPSPSRGGIQGSHADGRHRYLSLETSKPRLAWAQRCIAHYLYAVGFSQRFDTRHSSLSLPYTFIRNRSRSKVGAGSDSDETDVLGFHVFIACVRFPDPATS